MPTFIALRIGESSGGGGGTPVWQRVGTEVSPVNVDDAFTVKGLEVKTAPDLFGSNAALVEYFDDLGRRFLQVSAESPGYIPIFFENATGSGGTTLEFYGTNDWSYASGYKDAFVDIDSNTPNIAFGLNEDGTSLHQTSFTTRAFTTVVQNAAADKRVGVAFSTLGLSVGTLSEIRMQLTTGAQAAGGFHVFGINELGVIAGGTKDLLTAAAPYTKWRFESLAPDSASAVGFQLDTQNTLATDGAKFLELLNNNVKVFEAKRDVDLVGDFSGSNIFNFYNDAADIAIQRAVKDSAGDGNIYDLFPVNTDASTQLLAIMSDDFTQGAGHSTLWNETSVSAGAGGYVQHEIFCERQGESDATIRVNANNTTSSDVTLRASGALVASGAEYKVSGFDQSALGMTDVRHTWVEASATPVAAMSHGGDMAIAGEMKIKVISQAAEPTLGADSFMALWIDTDDANRTYLLFRRGVGDHVKVELA